MTQSVSFGKSGSGLFTLEEVRSLMEIEFERSMRYRYPLACLIIQIDRLVELETMHGWESKQEILSRVVDLVKRETRETDLFGYLVEDRLLAVFPHTTGEEVKTIAERLLGTVRDERFQGPGGAVRVTLSIGYSHSDHPYAKSFETLELVAHEGLVVADAGGGDRLAETQLYELYEDKRVTAPDEPTLKPGAQVTPVADYQKQLEEMVARDGDLEKAASELADEIVTRAVVEEAGEDRDGQLADRERQFVREIELLQRRVAKLTESLGLSEVEIARLRELKGVDAGLASVYREVQGLSMEDAHAELKKELMDRIFEANLDLQDKREAG